MKIVAIAQFYNELEGEYLEQFVASHHGLFDEVIVYDDGSTDGTSDFCRFHGYKVIGSRQNNFLKEIEHKRKLIEEADKFTPDFIISLDADEVCANSRSELEAICANLLSSGADGISCNFINLWRSNRHKRTDSLFDDLKPVKIWKHKLGVPAFEYINEGLHQKLYPDYVKNVIYDENFVILHTGFCTKERIMEKFLRYRALGQTGFNLLRFIDESKLQTIKVEDKYFPLNWPNDVNAPDAITVKDYFIGIEELKDKVFRPKISVFSLIYKDIGWLDFVYNQFLKSTDLDGVEFYFIANGATDEVINYLHDNFIPYYEYTPTKTQKQEHYINNVYRAYNYGVEKAKADCVVLLNSDMAFSEGWLSALVRANCDKTCVSSRLIEQGKLATGKHGIEKNFGSSWENYDEVSFKNYAKSISSNEIHESGLYMPLLVRKKDFLAVGGYPEGNILEGSDPFDNKIAKPGDKLISGDVAFIEKLKTIGVSHVTAFDSIIYHFQEGEKRSAGSVDIDKLSGSKIVIANNKLNGINGEKVLWGQLLDFQNTIGLDFERVQGKTPLSFETFIKKLKIRVSFVFQNATFIPILMPSRFSVLYLQDNLRRMKNISPLQEYNLEAAQALVTNVSDNAASYPEFDFEICPIGVDEKLFSPMDKKNLRTKYGFKQDDFIGIFVGALDEVKGWNEIKKIIAAEQKFKWIIVTKYEQVSPGDNVYFFAQQPQEALAELLNCADFFILGSSVETQCLAAVEAAFCNLPIVMKPVGIFTEFNENEKKMVGEIGNDLHKGVLEVYKKIGQYSPRETMLSKGLSSEIVKQKWWHLLAKYKMLAISSEYRRAGSVRGNPNLITIFKNNLDILFRFYILKPVLGRDTLYTIAEISVYLKRYLPVGLFKLLRAIWRVLR